MADCGQRTDAYDGLLPLGRPESGCHADGSRLETAAAQPLVDCREKRGRAANRQRPIPVCRRAVDAKGSLVVAPRLRATPLGALPRSSRRTSSALARTYSHYPGLMFAQFLAWYTDRGGVYVGCEDTEGNVKVLKAVKRREECGWVSPMSAIGPHRASESSSTTWCWAALPAIGTMRPISIATGACSRNGRLRWQVHGHSQVALGLAGLYHGAAARLYGSTNR